MVDTLKYDSPRTPVELINCKAYLHDAQALSSSIQPNDWSLCCLLDWINPIQTYRTWYMWRNIEGVGKRILRFWVIGSLLILDNLILIAQTGGLQKKITSHNFSSPFLSFQTPPRHCITPRVCVNICITDVCNQHILNSPKWTVVCI